MYSRAPSRVMTMDAASPLLIGPSLTHLIQVWLICRLRGDLLLPNADDSSEPYLAAAVV